MKNKIFQIFAFVLIFLMSLSIVRNIGRIVKIRSEVAKERRKLEKIKKENEALEKQISQTQGVEFVERELRNKLGLAKEGETIVVLPDKETLKKLAPQVYKEEEALPDPNWKKWAKLFF